MTRWQARLASGALTVGAWAALCAGPVHAAPSPYIEDLTSPELQARLDAGAKTVLVPIGGTEQSGPHIALGKHNARVRVLAGEIAQRLGNAVVAPVLAYVPEGRVQPPQAHMRFAGTISIPDAAFEAVLEGTARSFKQHGFRLVVFLGDHGGYQASERHVAARLNQAWARDPACRVLALTSYYEVGQTTFVDALRRQGFSQAAIGTHAGLADTALTLALAPSLVRRGALNEPQARSRAAGVAGDPRLATAELGQIGVHEIVESSVAAIQAAQRAP